MKENNPIFVKKNYIVKVYFLGTGTSQGIPIIEVNILFVVAPILKTKDSRIDYDFMGELYLCC
jgi:hypothetical protein